jgi:hypothetical protein
MDYRSFLRRVFKASQEFVREEMEDASPSYRAGLQREAAALEELLEALDTGQIDADTNVQLLLADLVRCIDSDNEYRRVTEEHVALSYLLAQIPGSMVRWNEISPPL